MIEGVRQAHCEKQIFRHNDMAHLEELLAAEPRRPKGRFSDARRKRAANATRPHNAVSHTPRRRQTASLR
jgi:hypothetical protein